MLVMVVLFAGDVAAQDLPCMTCSIRRVDWRAQAHFFPHSTGDVVLSEGTVPLGEIAVPAGRYGWSCSVGNVVRHTRGTVVFEARRLACVNGRRTVSSDAICLARTDDMPIATLIGGGLFGGTELRFHLPDGNLWVQVTCEAAAAEFRECGARF